MWIAFALKLLTFVSKKFQYICVSLDVNFNESLTNDGPLVLNNWALDFCSETRIVLFDCSVQGLVRRRILLG